MENNAKAEKLQQYISDKHEKHLTEVFKIFIYTTISTHTFILIHTFILFIYTFDVFYITLFFAIVPVSTLHQSISHSLNSQLLMFLSLTILFPHHLLIGLQSFTMDFQNKISNLYKSSNYVSKLPIDNRIKDLLIQELKRKQKINNSIILN